MGRELVDTLQCCFAGLGLDLLDARWQRFNVQKTLIIIYLPVNAGGGTVKNAKNATAERKKEAHITNEFYGGYDTK